MRLLKNLRHCTVEGIGLKLTGEDAPAVIAASNEYLKQFAAPVGICPKCNAQLSGMLGSFRWGVAHGEGSCTGGVARKKCGWPCRGMHRLTDADGEELFDAPLQVVLAYHPDALVESSVVAETTRAKKRSAN